jgi:transcriptional regulator with XRE-family HTH domain
MAFSNPLQNHPDAAQLRKEAGVYLRKVREQAGVTQQALAKALGLEYYTMVSAVELGKARLPPERTAQWAQVLGVDPYEFAMRLMHFYDPYTWEIVRKGSPKAK